MGERLTASDVEKIKKEIEYRKLVVRKSAIAAVKEARAQGDLSENCEDSIYIPEDDVEETYKLVTSIRSNSQKGLISIESPLGSAIRGKKVGETATVVVNPSYSYDVVIRKIDKTTDDKDDQIKRY